MIPLPIQTIPDGKRATMNMKIKMFPQKKKVGGKQILQDLRTVNCAIHINSGEDTSSNEGE